MIIIKSGNDTEVFKEATGWLMSGTNDRDLLIKKDSETLAVFSAGAWQMVKKAEK